MTDVVVWRHGQTDYNRDGRVQGRVDIPLNDDGLAQAAQAAQNLAALGPAAIFSSPLSRALQTAQALSDLTGAEVRTRQDLVERSFGAWEGKTRQEIKSGWPGEYGRWRAGEDPEGVGVETREQVARRFGGALEEIARGARQAAAQDQGPVVVVAHGSAITLGVSYLLGLEVSSWFGLRGLDNCHHGLVRSVSRAPGWMLVRWSSWGVA